MKTRRDGLRLSSRPRSRWKRSRATDGGGAGDQARACIRTRLRQWKRQAIEKLAKVFDDKSVERSGEPRRRGDEAARQDRAACGGAGFFGQSLRSLSLDRRKTMIDPGHPAALDRAPVRAGLDLARSRSTASRRAESEENLALMRLIDEAVPGDALVWLAADGAASAAARLVRRPPARPAADAQDRALAPIYQRRRPASRIRSTRSTRICCGI